VHTGKARQLKARQLLDNIWDDYMLPLFEKTDTFQERITDSTVKVIQSELKQLQEKTRAFGKYDPSVNIEEEKYTMRSKSMDLGFSCHRRLLSCSTGGQTYPEG
jgi:hypothetical protein